MDHTVYIAGELDVWPSMEQMISMLRAGGLSVTAGRYSIRIDNCSHFVFQEYGGDLCEPSIVADAATPEEMLRDIKLVSAVLANAGIKHRFELYDENDELIGYLHHDWPLESST